MRRRKPKEWDGDSRMCTSPYPVKKGGCLGEIDFGQGQQLDYPGHDKQRYCHPCVIRMHREEEEAWEKKQAEKAKTISKEQGSGLPSKTTGEKNTGGASSSSLTPSELLLS